MNMYILADAGINTPVLVFLIVLGAVALIAIFAFLLRLYLRPKLKSDDKPTEDQVLEEEMNRLLKPIDDDDTAQAVSEYKEEDD